MITNDIAEGVDGDYDEADNDVDDGDDGGADDVDNIEHDGRYKLSIRIITNASAALPLSLPLPSHYCICRGLYLGLGGVYVKKSRLQRAAEEIVWLRVKPSRRIRSRNDVRAAKEIV